MWRVPFCNKDLELWGEVSPFSSFPTLYPSPPMWTPPTFPSSLLFRKVQTSHGYQKIIAYQVSVRLKTLPFLKAGQGNLVWEIGSQKSAKESEIAPSPTLRGSSKKNKLHSCHIYVEGLCLSHADSLVASSVFVSSYEHRLVDYVDFLVMFLTLLSLKILLLFLQQCSMSSA